MEAIIGVIGTLVGTILGWVLNNISQRGKLNVYVTQWSDDFDYNEGVAISNANAIQETYGYSYKLAVDIYNSSAETRIMRDIRIVFKRDKNALYTITPNYKADTKTVHGRATLTSHSKIGTVNVSPKSVVSYNFYSHINNNQGATDCFWEINNIVLTYRNEKDKIIVVPIKKEDYHNYRKNHFVEER
ncbi:MAG: hypothetical protein J6K84_02290 [Oscillospiraceae bacterium]|nr:hypothetical protein [Oscillospiraceae bacterium]